MGEVGGHQHGVPGREGAGLTVAHTGVDQVGAFTCAATVTTDGHVKGWGGGHDRGMRKELQETVMIMFLRLKFP